MTISYDHELDARNLQCPIPIIRARAKLTKLKKGQVLKVLATDLGTVSDIPALCKRIGDKLLEATTQEKDYVYYIEKCRD